MIIINLRVVVLREVDIREEDIDPIEDSTGFLMEFPNWFPIEFSIIDAIGPPLFLEGAAGVNKYLILNKNEYVIINNQKILYQ